ncbi:Coiled-coil domain-containing protein 144A [Camelus dromedarius]|uniref:Coiled-coil domain-containing protein 144A n=1 Tax=Camelus dromedarius TaxID=9838 RepID=A0A5N4C4N1_CAMDR|nr:Coiled-coil domain-containing protein 144A [Camelus dromedarius]
MLSVGGLLSDISDRVPPRFNYRTMLIIYLELQPAVGVKDSVPNKPGGMKNLQTFKSGKNSEDIDTLRKDWLIVIKVVPFNGDSTSLRPNNAAGQRAQHLKVDKCPLVSQSVTTDQSAPTELRQTALVDKDQMNIGAVSLSENAVLCGLRESQLPENSSSKEACTVKEKKSEGQIRQINLSPVHLQKMPGEPGMNKEQDRKDVPVSSKHSCVEKHEDMWVKKGKLDWKNNTKFITKKLNQKVSKIREKCKITVHRKTESLHGNSELHGDLKELPSSVTNNICDSEEQDAPGASISVGFQAFPQHEEPSLESVFPSYSKSGSAKYGSQSSSKLYLNENKLTENDKPDTEHVFNKNEEGFYNDRANEIRNRVRLLVEEDQEFDTKRKQKRSRNTPWKSDTGHAPQVSDPESLFGLWLARSSEMKHMIQIKSHDMTAVSNTHKKTKPIQDQLQKPLLADNCGANNSKIMDPKLGNKSVWSSKKTSAKKDKVKEQVNSVGDLDDLTLSPETASEDCESPYPNYKNTLRLIERLGLECKGRTPV